MKLKTWGTGIATWEGRRQWGRVCVSGVLGWRRAAFSPRGLCAYGPTLLLKWGLDSIHTPGTISGVDRNFSRALFKIIIL